jgi:DNA polymerase-4
VAENKFLAKLASDMNKPDGLMVFGPEEVERVLPGLEVGRIFGIGPKTAARLESVGVRTIGDLRRMPAEWVAARLGSGGEFLQALAWGRDDRPVSTEEETKSIGHEETFEEDLGEPESVEGILLGQVEAVGERLRRHGLQARRVALKIRFGDFQTVSRSKTLAGATDVTAELWGAARELWRAWVKAGFRPVRLIGMTAEGLGGEEAQMELFANPEKEKAGKVDQALDEINRRFGKRIVHRGGAG